MSLKFWLGGAKSDKSRRLVKYILEDADMHPERQYLVVVPEQFGLAMQQELIASSKNHGILNIDVLSFTRLAHRISDEVGSVSSGVTTLDEMGKSLIIGMLASRVQSELKVFGGDLDKPGYTDRLKSIISEFMQYGLSVDKVYELSEAATSQGRGLLSEKLHDVAVLYEAFKNHIKDRYTTVEETLDTVSRLIPNSDTVKNSVVVFDGFTGFTPVQNKLIGVLLEYAKEVHVSLLFEDCIQENLSTPQNREHELFYMSRNTMDQLGRMADERQVTIDDPYKARIFEFNNARYFNGGDVYSKDTDGPELNNTSVRIFAGQNPMEEIEMTFSRIMELIRDHGYRYRDIAILTADIGSYRHAIERVLGRHDIPFFIDRTEPVVLNPFIEYIRAFIDVIADNYSISSVFRFLKSGLTDFTIDEVNILENYCIAANIKGYKAWHERFDMLTEAAREDELLTLNGIRERFIAVTDGFCSDLDTTRRINAGSEFTVKEFCVALYNLIVSDGIEDKLKSAANRFEESGNRRFAAEYGQIYAKIMDILDELCELITDEKTDIRGFGRLLEAGLDSIRIGVLPTGMDYVQVGDLTRSRVGNVKALFIVGANDGIIPQTSNKIGIINDNERDFLMRMDDRLILAPTAREDLYTQQLYVYMAMSKPAERLYVSYAYVSASGSSLLPSYIVKKILSADPSVHIEKKPTAPQYYTDETEAFDELISAIYPALSGSTIADKSLRIKDLLIYFLNNDKYRARLLSVLEKEILRTGSDATDSIGAALAHAIYGKRITENITKLENYAKCAYRYFLQYGLNLHEREVFSFESRDIGNIFHDSMKEYSIMMSESGNSWTDISEDDRNRLMDEAVDKVIERYRLGKLSSSARYAYMENRIRRIMRTSADIVGAQIKKGKFVPKYFEVDFDRLDNDRVSIKLSDDEMMRLRGRIDRVDTYEADDGVYIRIIDYKSSRHEMDLAAVYEGRQLQLLVYLNAAVALEEDVAKTNGAYKKIIPAGVLYYHMDDPVIAAKSELTGDEIHDLVMKKLCLNGLVASDRTVLELMDEDLAVNSTVLPVTVSSKGEVRKNKQTVSGDDLDVMAGYVNKRMQCMGEELISGNIAIPVPDNKTRFTGPDCAFCPYTSVCANKGKITLAADDDEEGTTASSKMTNDEWIAKMRTYGTDR